MALKWIYSTNNINTTLDYINDVLKKYNYISDIPLDMYTIIIFFLIKFFKFLSLYNYFLRSLKYLNLNPTGESNTFEGVKRKQRKIYFRKMSKQQMAFNRIVVELNIPQYTSNSTV